MQGLSKARGLLVAALGALALAGCGGGGGADAVSSPGETTLAGTGGSGGTGGGGTGGGGLGPAADCPAGFTNTGTVANGSLRACQLPSRITGAFTVPARAGTVYQITGRVDVGDDQGGNAAAPIAGRVSGTLTIDAGVRLFGSSGLDYIVVNRGSQIFAQGAPTLPVIFTSRASVDGQTNIDSIGQWGGLVILGRAPIANCPGTVTPGSANCEAQVEGTNAFYGGNSATDSSGILRYVRLMHSGFQILPNQELNGITLAGVGNGTTIDFVQVHNSSDDGIEWFGGTVNAKHLVLTGNDDDSLDTDVGFNGFTQFIIAVQRANGGDRIFETSDASTRRLSNPKFVNFTVIGRGVSDVIVMNTGTNNRFVNGVARASGTTAACLDIDDATTLGTFNSVVFSCPVPYREDTNVNAAGNAAIFTAGANNNAAHVSTLASVFIDGPNELAVTPFNVASLSTFLTPVNYIGAVRDANDTWWQGWTCGLVAGSTC